MVKAAVIGYGSIGSRHTRILESFGIEVAVVSRRHLSEVKHSFTSINDCLSQWQPNYIVLANETSEHLSVYKQLINLKYSGKLLIEKPIFTSIPEEQLFRSQTFVAYNLRFSPILRRLKDELTSQKVLAASVFCGQYLPQWRPDRNINDSYSSKRSMGGGVLRDLSHELDYCVWLFGYPEVLAALVEKKSDLPIDCEDACSILMRSAKGTQISIHINYLAMKAVRRLHITTSEHQYEADLIDTCLIKDGIVEKFSVDRDFTYSELHRTILNYEHHCNSLLCSYDEAILTLRLIEGCEESSKHRIWINL